VAHASVVEHCRDLSIIAASARPVQSRAFGGAGGLMGLAAPGTEQWCVIGTYTQG
jgi:hypothetical protein